MNTVGEAPELSTDPHGPAVAELARSLVATASSVLVGLLRAESEAPRHAVLEDGSIILERGQDADGWPRFAGAHLPARQAQMILTDVAPVALADRVRGEVIMVGELADVMGPLPTGVREHLLMGRPAGEATFLRFTPHRVLVRSRLLGHLGGVVPLDAETYRAAHPDPLVEVEQEWLEHLDRGHADVLDALAAAATPRGVRAVARPLRLDRGGVVVEVSTARGSRPVRFDFAAPLRCGCELGWAVEELLDRLNPAA